MSQNAVTILLVEDDQVDQELVRRKFKAVNITNPLYIANDGVEALDMLRGYHKHKPLPQPCLVLLDINLPRMSGFEMLRVMRGDPQLRKNVVFMLSTSTRQIDINLAYDLYAAGYFNKKNMDSIIAILNLLCKTNEFGLTAQPPKDHAPDTDERL